MLFYTGKKFECLVDTGGSCTIIRRNVVENLSPDLENGEFRTLQSFSGNPVL